MNRITLSNDKTFVELWHNGQKIASTPISSSPIFVAVESLRQHIKSWAGDGSPELSRELIAEMGKSLLDWHFDGEGSWESASAINDDGYHFTYRVVVCGDGTFDVSETDSELIGDRKPACFASLDSAQDWCAANEVAMTFRLTCDPV